MKATGVMPGRFCVIKEMGEEKLTEEQMEKINWLNRAFYADNMIKALEAIRERNKSIAERCTASYDSTGSSGSYANSQETIIHTICDDNIRIQKQLDELIICRAEIKEAIEGIGNAELVTIMNMRYLAYMKPYQIAEAYAERYALFLYPFLEVITMKIRERLFSVFMRAKYDYFYDRILQISSDNFGLIYEQSP